MSAGVSDQRMKGQGNQVSNVGKDHIQSDGGVGVASGEDLSEASWRHQQQQPAQQPPSYAQPISSADPYATAAEMWSEETHPECHRHVLSPKTPSKLPAGPDSQNRYYSSGTPAFPYQAFGVGDGTWSTNGTDQMTFLGGYNPHDTYGMEGVFSPSSTTFSTAAFGQPASAPFNYFHGNGDYSAWGQLSRAKQYDDYYRTDGLYVPDGLKAVEQGVQALGLGDPKQDKDRLPIQDIKDGGGSQPKKTTWASIASQPAKPTPPSQSSGLKKKGPGMPPPPIVPGKHNMDIGTWDGGKSGASTPPQVPAPVRVQPPAPRASAPSGPPAAMSGPPIAGPPPAVTRTPWSGNGGVGATPPRSAPPPMQPPSHMPTHLPPQHHQQPMPPQPLPLAPLAPLPPAAVLPPQPNPVLDELRVKNDYNPTDFDLSAPGARFFVIKSYSEDDIHRSIKYEIWCSTDHGNKRLDGAYREREREGGLVYLYFSVNGSGHFCGMAQMVSAVDYNSNSSVWSQDKWKGQFKVRWIYVKDVPNVQLRHIKLENNENKPVTNSRDTQEVPHVRGLQVLRILHGFCHSTSIFDDFVHYEKRQEEEDSRKLPEPHPSYQRENYHQGGYDKPHGGYEKHDNYSGGSRGGYREHGGGGGYNRDHGRDLGYKEHGGEGPGNGRGYKGHQRDRNPPRDPQEHPSYRERDREPEYRPHHNPHYKERGGDGTPRGRGRGRN